MRNFKVVLFVLGCLCGIHIQAQQLEIKGVVTSSDDKQPLIGATVSVKGAPGRGVVTDMDGRYSLHVEASDKFLVVSYVGMKTVEVKVPKNGVLNVMLRPESLSLDEVVVTGYGNFSNGQNGRGTDAVSTPASSSALRTSSTSSFVSCGSRYWPQESSIRWNRLSDKALRHSGRRISDALTETAYRYMFFSCVSRNVASLSSPRSGLRRAARTRHSWRLRGG